MVFGVMKQACSVPCLGVVHASGWQLRTLLPEALYLSRVHKQGCLHLPVVELRPPYLRLWLECVQECLCPKQVVARGALVILEHAIGVEGVVKPVEAQGHQHCEAQGQVGAGRNIAADARTLVSQEDGLLKALHGLDRVELAALCGVQGVHLVNFKYNIIIEINREGYSSA
ncbi:hypothetical protein FGO68_gene12216 [Halteria grandinella]|uniref:Uncharacterized protein n=1 Tax=Halteria grandinella TaxID=5974 RepID=A0A8J8NHW7_HALGN|nr:hypothetical protein FGO68_gene12216 [Halteria grandinella]